MLDIILNTGVYKIFDFNRLLNNHNQNILFPFYHTVSDTFLPHVNYVYEPKSSKQFKADLEFFLKYFEPVEPENLGLIKKNGKKKILLSFDDGLKECYHIIRPILKQFAIPAIFFVNTSFIDNKNLFFRYKASLLVNYLRNKKLTKDEFNKVRILFYRNNYRFKDINNAIFSITYNDQVLLDYIAELIQFNFNDFLKTNQPYMTQNQIHELIQDGFTIGSHSLNHPMYNQMNLEEQIVQTTESIIELQKQFKITKSYFAFPFTDYGVKQSFFNRLKQFANLSLQYTFGTAGLKNEAIPNHLQRIPMEKSNYTAKQLVHAELFYYKLKSFIGYNTINRE